MNFDPETINKLSKMNKDELSKKIEEISGALGVDPLLVKRAVGSPDQIQKKLRNISEADLRRMAGSIDPETINKINKTLGE